MSPEVSDSIRLEVRTSHEGCSRLECSETQAINDITNDVMTRVSAKFTVSERQCHQRHACVKCLHAVPIGICPHNRDETISEDNSVAKSNKSGWDRAVGLILGIFFKPYSLVGGDKLKEVYPNPESGFKNVRNLKVRCSSNGEARLWRGLELSDGLRD